MANTADENRFSTDPNDGPEPTVLGSVSTQETYLNREFQDIHFTITELESHLSFLQEKESTYEAEKGRRMKEFEEIVEDRDREARDNEVLRSLVANLKRPLAPRYDDVYYIYRMQRLNESIKSWTNSAFKAREFEQPMSATEEDQLIHLLRKNLPEHIVWLEAVRQRSGIRYISIHAKPRARIALARHLVALSIWKNIFHPACFGISGELKKGIKTVMESVYAEGNQFPFVMVIKQGIGRGLLRHLEPSHERLKESLVKSLDQILTLLLPVPYNLFPKIKKTIDRAVEIKNEIVCEQGLFKYRMVRSEEPFSPHKMEFSPDAQKGSVFVCTFPGLLKTDVAKNGNMVDVVLCKANVELDSVFLDSY